MTLDHGRNKTSGSYYLHAPRNGRKWPSGHRQIIGPDVQRKVAELYESGHQPNDIAAGMQIPRPAVQDIIAAYEWRAERFFRATRGRAS